MPNPALRAVFDMWESFFHHAFRLEDLEPGVEHLFYIAKRRYMGRPFEVDGVKVRSGDRVVELHVNNDMVERALREDSNVVRAMVQLLRQARTSMPALARAIQSPRYAETQALYGITMIHRGIERFGFHTLPLPDGISKSLTTWHLTNVLRMLNPDADHLIQTHHDVLQPKLVVASKARIIELFSTPGHQVKDTDSSSVRVAHSDDSPITLQS
ncbi:YkoP family protein [Alicyclobacillus acidiphilus]|uniref:YkoP family protein n=1 Tax=Alicyclobacillus acidiphilus TaxID=182455 RepID=UPI00082C011B|nr:polysaccharide deacetylase [Alicyclobacillus acidiphilus]